MAFSSWRPGEPAGLLAVAMTVLFLSLSWFVLVVSLTASGLGMMKGTNKLSSESEAKPATRSGDEVRRHDCRKQDLLLYCIEYIDVSCERKDEDA